MSRLDVTTAQWLASPDGLDAVATATAEIDSGHDALQVGTRRQADAFSPEQTAAVLTAAAARIRARESWPDADQLLFTREALEQASHPTVSHWRAQRFRERSVWDLCAGIGGDAAALASFATALVAVEQDPALAVLLEHNLNVRGFDVQVQVGDALEVRVQAGASIHADPSRRDGERRRPALRDHAPPVGRLVEQHAGSTGLGIVLSPAVDLADPDLPGGELEFVQVGERLVEAVVWTGGLRDPRSAATATLLPAGLAWHRPVEAGARRQLPVGALGDYLVEVAPAAVRARVHDGIGATIGARRIATSRALLTVDGAPPISPWYRARPILAVLAPRPRAVRAWLRSVDAAAVEVVLHGVQADVGRWWRELGRPPRGPNGYRVEVVRLDDGARAVVTDAS